MKSAVSKKSPVRGGFLFAHYLLVRLESLDVPHDEPRLPAANIIRMLEATKGRVVY